jgi:hypothetical protein
MGSTGRQDDASLLKLNIYVDLPTFVHLFPFGQPVWRTLMKRFVVLFLAMLLACTYVFAQQEEEPPIPPKRSKAGKVGAFGGFTPGWLFVDVGPINDFLVPAGGAPLEENGVFLWGGGGAAYIMLVPNLRVGGLGMSGSTKSTKLDAFGVRRDAELNVGFGGVTFEYVIPVFERFDVAVGTMLGGGGIDLILRQDIGGISTWEGEKLLFQNGGPSVNSKRTLSGSYFVWVPSVNVEYAVLGWLGFRLGASYVGMTSPSWTVDDDHELLGVPSSVSGKGFMINAGVLVGTF